MSGKPWWMVTSTSTADPRIACKRLKRRREDGSPRPGPPGERKWRVVWVCRVCENVFSNKALDRGHAEHIRELLMTRSICKTCAPGSAVEGYAPPGAQFDFFKGATE